MRIKILNDADMVEETLNVHPDDIAELEAELPLGWHVQNF